MAIIFPAKLELFSQYPVLVYPPSPASAAEVCQLLGKSNTGIAGATMRVDILPNKTAEVLHHIALPSAMAGPKVLKSSNLNIFFQIF